MARGRLISRTLGSSRKFHDVLRVGGSLGEFCQVLFPLIVANTDDWGRMDGDAFTVKHQVLPSSPRLEPEFEQALDVLAEVGLIDRYLIDGRIYLQINQFDTHQPNLHKRTPSRFPESPGISRNSGNVPDLPAQYKRTEFKGTEGKGTEGSPAPPSNVPAVPDSRSKRPIFKGQRVTVFDWQLEDFCRLLGPHADAFDLHEWFFGLDAQCVTRGEVPPKRDGGAWLESQLVAEAQRRGLPLKPATGPGPPGNKRIAALVAGGRAFLEQT